MAHVSIKLHRKYRAHSIFRLFARFVCVIELFDQRMYVSVNAEQITLRTHNNRTVFIHIGHRLRFYACAFFRYTSKFYIRPTFSLNRTSGLHAKNSLRIEKSDFQPRQNKKKPTPIEKPKLHKQFVWVNKSFRSFRFCLIVVVVVVAVHVCVLSTYNRECRWLSCSHLPYFLYLIIQHTVKQNATATRSAVYRRTNEQYC